MRRTITIDGRNLALNAKDGGDRPVFLISADSGDIAVAGDLTILGPCRLVYDIHARARIETTSEVTLHGSPVTGPTKIIHVNRQHISMNARDGLNRPVFTMKHRGLTRYAREVGVLGPSVLVYNGSQLSCGARAWISTAADVELLDEMTFNQARSLEGELT